MNKQLNVGDIVLQRYPESPRARYTRGCVLVVHHYGVTVQWSQRRSFELLGSVKLEDAGEDPYVPPVLRGGAT